MWKLANVTPTFKKGDKQLIKNYRPNGISGSLIKLFENYLHNRKQRVVLNGSYSDFL